MNDISRHYFRFFSTEHTGESLPCFAITGSDVNFLQPVAAATNNLWVEATHPPKLLLFLCFCSVKLCETEVHCRLNSFCSSRCETT